MLILHDICMLKNSKTLNPNSIIKTIRFAGSRNEQKLLKKN